MTWILIAIAWYLIGFIGGCIILKKADGKVTVGEFVFMLTVGGIGGLFGVLIGLNYLNPTWWKIKCLKR